MKPLTFLDLIVPSKGLVLALIVLLNLALHFPFMNLPPQSIHVWRQTSTLAVARNFSEEDMNILNPRIDRRLDKDGITGTQFPSYEYLVALGYRVFGEHHWVERSIAFLIYCLGAWGIYELFFILFAMPWAAALGAWGFCWSPELFYFGISALPDVTALTCSIWGLALFLKWFKGQASVDLWLSLVFTTLGGLTKVQYLVIGFPIAVLVLSRRRYSVSQIGALTLYAVVSVGLTLAWYFRAVNLIHSSGLADYDIGFTPAPSWAWAFHTLWHNLHIEILELILNYASSVFFVVGLVVWFRHPRTGSRWFLPLGIWALMVGVYYLIELGKMDVHSYYLLPFLPLLLIFVVEGALFLKTSRWRWLFLILFIAQPVVAYFRIVPPRFWTKDPSVPAELYNEDPRSRLERAVPNNALCVVGPDNSGAIYFYFLHKKGFGFSSIDELTQIQDQKSLIENDIRRGAEYLYLQGEPTAALKPYLKTKVYQEGGFAVYRLGLKG